MKSSFKKYQKVYVQELIFFVAMFVLTTIHEWIEVNTFMQFLKGLVFFLILYLHAQFHRFFTFPLFLEKKYSAYFGVTLTSLILSSLFLFSVTYYWITPDYFQSKSINYFRESVYFLVLNITSTITILVLFITKQYYTEIQKRDQDKILMNEMHIKLLHAQINPHFVFNMFNNLYAVSLTDSSRVPDLILKLSNLMRYQMETGVKASVSIFEEVQFIKNYIAMEKERIGKRCQIEYTYPEDESSLTEYQISPLILINLIENAFKHSLTITSKWFVNIKIELTKGRLQLDIRNSIPDDSLKTQSTGIGLSNIRQRLKLLHEESYEFESVIKDGEYVTLLEIQLKHV